MQRKGSRAVTCPLLEVPLPGHDDALRDASTAAHARDSRVTYPRPVAAPEPAAPAAAYRHISLIVKAAALRNCVPRASLADDASPVVTNALVSGHVVRS